MTITKEVWLKATAEAMSTEGCKELFESDSIIEDLFTDYSFQLLLNLSGKTLDKSEFIQTVADNSKDILLETGMGTTSVLVNIALICFAGQIWENLVKLTKSERINSEYENFKSVLKAQKSE